MKFAAKIEENSDFAQFKIRGFVHPRINLVTLFSTKSYLMNTIK
jgi:hypothetical protein